MRTAQDYVFHNNKFIDLRSRSKFCERIGRRDWAKNFMIQALWHFRRAQEKLRESKA